MLCERCGNAEVTVDLTRIVDHVVTRHALCDACATAMGVSLPAEPLDPSLVLDDATLAADTEEYWSEVLLELTELEQRRRADPGWPAPPSLNLGILQQWAALDDGGMPAEIKAALARLGLDTST